MGAECMKDQDPEEIFRYKIEHSRVVCTAAFWGVM